MTEIVLETRRKFSRQIWKKKKNVHFKSNQTYLLSVKSFLLDLALNTGLLPVNYDYRYLLKIIFYLILFILCISFYSNLNFSTKKKHFH